MTNLEVSFSILGFIVASLSAYYTYKAYKKPTNNISKTTQFTLGCMSSSEILWASLSLGAIVVVAVLALVFVLVSHRKQRDITVEDETGLLPVDPGATGEVWVVANPTKPSDYDALRNQINAEVVRAQAGPPGGLKRRLRTPEPGRPLRHCATNPHL